MQLSELQLGVSKGVDLVNAFNDNFKELTIPQNGLADAITKIGSSDGRIIIGTSQAISSNTVIPKNISIVVQRGGSFTISSGKTLTVNGTLESGIYKIFNIISASQLSFASGSLNCIYPEWFTDNSTPGTTDMTNAFQYAIDLCYDIELQRISYKITDTLVLNNGTKIIGKNRHIGSAGTSAFSATTIYFDPISSKDLFDIITNNIGGYMTGINLKGIDIIGNTFGGNTNSRYAINHCTVGSVFECIGIMYFEAGIYISNCLENKYRELLITNCSITGIYTSAGSTNLGNIFDNVHVDSCPWGAILRSSTNFKFINCLWQSLSTGGINIYKGSDATFISNYAEDVCNTSLADTYGMFYIGHDGASTDTSGLKVIGGGLFGRNLTGAYHGSFLDVGLGTITNSGRIQLIGVSYGRYVNGIKVDSALVEEYTVFVSSIQFVEIQNLFVGDTITTNGGFRIYGFVDDTQSGTFNQPSSISWATKTKSIRLADGQGDGEIELRGAKPTMIDDSTNAIPILVNESGMYLVTMTDNALVNEAMIVMATFNNASDVPVVIKLFGTANTSITDTDGNLCIFAGIPTSDYIFIKNRLSVTVTAVILRIY